MNVLIANAIDLVVAFVQVGSGTLRKKSTILIVMTIQQLMQAVSMLLLGGVTGAINNIISCVRNCVCYKGKLTLPWKILFITFYLVMGVSLNTQGLLGLIPAVSSTIYIIFMDVKDPIRFKILGVCIIMMWIVYNLVIQAYVGAFFNAAAAVTNVITILAMIRDAKALPQESTAD